MTQVENGRGQGRHHHRQRDQGPPHQPTSPSAPRRPWATTSTSTPSWPRRSQVNVERDQTPAWANMLISWAPFLLLIGFWVFFMRQMQSGGNKALSFGKSKAKLLASPAEEGHVQGRGRRGRGQGGAAGDHRVPARAPEVPEAGRPHPQGRAPHGPPGDGQDAAGPRHRRRGQRARSSPSPAPTSWRCSWAWAPRACATCSSRARRTPPASSSSTRSTPWAATAGPGLGGGHDEREQTLNQLLVEMDGFESNDGVILIAATNRPDVLDPALLRPGRFDRRVVVSRPDVRGREGILQVHTRKIPLAEDVDISVLARGTPGFSGADLANLVNEAALAGRPAQPEVREHVRLRVQQGQGPDGRGAQEHDHHRRGEEGHRLPRGGARPGGRAAARHRPPAQGDDHPARHGPGRDPAAPHRGEAQLHQGAAGEPHRGVHGRPHRRGHHVRRDLHRRRRTTSSRPRRWPARWSASGA